MSRKLLSLAALCTKTPTSLKNFDKLNVKFFETSAACLARKSAEPTQKPAPLPRRGNREDDDDDFDDEPDTGLPSFALYHIRQIKYIRMFQRKAKFEAPKLKEHLEKFIPPGKNEYVQFLNVTHLGEEHELDKKSVMIIKLNELADRNIFTPEQTHKLLLICQNHYFRESNLLRFSSKAFPTLDQNKLHLAKLWKKIVKEVKDTTDMFGDIPLPAYKPKSSHNRLTKEQIEFPKEWLQKAL
ncbi:37S ribosomal protein S24, mitochondrial [Entomophthora muscae]|uniref:37S ribosomal protein S24, mitochondrial n=1 Tax=Entomophthora muscae TaxID=34485 RepID=A0ACC2U1N7_9FUNG|nr:37S ribosomal protein S24, mitochondrial [Entomophthora muscae]